jgi:hypothetical protein
MKLSFAAVLALLATGLSAQPAPRAPSAAHPLRVYVAGESIEVRNRYVEQPFTAAGALNDRGGGSLRNDNEEYGWMVPLRDRLKLRAPDLTLEFVGSGVWADADDNPYTGTYPTTTPEPTSAISGTSIPAWLALNRGELESRTFCYDLAFASRGGNDFGNDDDTAYKTQLKELVVLLAHGSSCQSSPIVVVTGHMPDDQGWGGGYDYGQLQLHRFAERSLEAVNELAVEQPLVRARFADQFTPFLNNQATTAFPAEVWSTASVIDYAKIARAGDGYHPRRLASIYAGELAADTLDLTELRALAGAVPGFYSVTPCRVVDTRNTAGAYGGPALAANVSRDFALSGQCGIPPDAAVAVGNLTVVNATGAGDLKAYPTGTASPTATAISFAPGKTRANNSLLLCGTPDLSVTVLPVLASGSVDFILDVSGYFK